MQTEWAAENLQIIRTLMERAAVYRRAVAPVMIGIGITGIAAGALGALLKFDSSRAFVGYWIAVAFVCLGVALVMIRRQALKDSEAFWSPPARRVAQAVSLAFASGLMFGLVCIYFNSPYLIINVVLLPIWMVLYGLAMHSAGFFMPRGFKLFGLIFVGAGFVVHVLVRSRLSSDILYGVTHRFSQGCWIMGSVFGGLHGLYGLYLYATEKRGNAS